MISLFSLESEETNNFCFNDKTESAAMEVTNVLSFQSDVPEEVGEQILGDVVICVDVVREEALVGGKVFLDHLIHMAIHGILHLLGHDHSDLTSADKMELIEINFLDKIGINNPYQ